MATWYDIMNLANGLNAAQAASAGASTAASAQPAGGFGSAMSNPMGLINSIGSFLGGFSRTNAPQATMSPPPATPPPKTTPTTADTATTPKAFDMSTPIGQAQMGSLLATMGGWFAKDERQAKAADDINRMAQNIIFANQLSEIMKGVQGPTTNP